MGLWVFPWATALGAQKTIHLRNETILTDPALPETARAKGVDRAVSGLYLVQLSGPVQEAWRTALAAQQVVLLHYVPDDCYVARVKGASLSQVRGLPFVQWVGAFRPEHKVHRSAQVAAAGGGGVAVLVAPDAGPAELAGVRQSLQQLLRESHTRMGTVLHGQASVQQVQALAESGMVLWIEPAPHIKMHDEISTKIVAGETDTPGTQALVHQMGYDGRGVTVSVADSGLYLGADAPMHPDLQGRVDAFYFYGLLDSAQDEHGHGSHTAGIVAANAATGEVDDQGYLYGLGVAPGAHLVIQRIFDGEGGYQAPPSNGALTADALAAGAEIGSNSWGDDVQGRYDLNAMEFDALVRDGDESKPGDQPYILEFSAGNAGPSAQTMDSPGVAKNVIATGATESDRTDFLIYGDGPDVMADFSSRGPCEDGRIKPDVVAPGTWISSLRSPAGNDDNAWATIDDYYAYEGGTSQAGPHVSGAAAVFVQWYRDTHTNATPSPALVKAALINSAVDLGFAGGTALAPNMDEGWGRVDLTEIIATSRQYQFTDQSVLLKTGQLYEQHVLVSSADDPLKVTLAYTDVPGFPGAVPALVNDLDLEVVGPDGAIYRGNQFLDGESVPNAPSADNINNVEGVVIWAPAVGDYLVRVRARSVAQDARVDTTALDQDFALVVSALMPQPGEGVIAFDRHTYTVPGQIIIRLLDSDLIGQLTTSVTLQSDSQPTPLTVLLHSLPAAPVFTGSVATAFAPAVLDGRLHILDGDEIRVSYFDASAGVNRTATALADLRDPVISNVAIASEFGRVVVRWTTDEIASSGVLYNNGQPPTRVTTNSLLETAHEMEITNLVYGQTYHFAVFSTDEAGNTATNDNGGAGYAFVPTAPPRVLLVDSCVDQNASLNFFNVPPISDYTLVLNQAGVVYDFWNATTGSKPTLGVLRNYRAVIWRLSDFGNGNGWSDWGPADLQMLTNYLAGGGSLLVASMEVLSRLEEANASWFNTNVLQVRAFGVDAGVPSIGGVASDPISSGFSASLDYSFFITEFSDLLGQDPDISDTITLTSAAAPILRRW